MCLLNLAGIKVQGLYSKINLPAEGKNRRRAVHVPTIH